jgi:predicted metal-dependent HD superfamily phosphohydrolase
MSSAAKHPMACMEERLEERWHRTWQALDLDPGAPFSELAAAYSEPHRAYHTLEHLAECFAVASGLRSSRLSGIGELALWYHDFIYDPRSGRNEEESASRCARDLRRASAPEPLVETACALIAATRHAASSSVEPPLSADAALLVDLDLAIFGAAEERFARYERAIAQEFGWVEPLQYRRGRAAVLRAFLTRQPLYRTAEVRECFELRARANLERALLALQAADP